MHLKLIFLMLMQFQLMFGIEKKNAVNVTASLTIIKLHPTKLCSQSLASEILETTTILLSKLEVNILNQNKG